MKTRRLASSLLLITLAACANTSDDGTDNGTSDLTGSGSSALATTERAFAELEAMRNAEPVGQFYKGGNEGARIRGCWQNPKGDVFTDMQKAVYCALPLEFRLCNSPVLLRTHPKNEFKDDENVIHDLLIVYRLCKGKAQEQFGSRFAFTPAVDDLYLRAFLRQQSGLSAADEAKVTAAHKPTTKGSIAVELIQIVAGLAAEAPLLGREVTSLTRAMQLSENDLANNSLHEVMKADPNVTVESGNVL
jgi:hypothetical protein